MAGYDAAGGRLVHVATTPTGLPELFSGERQLTDVGRAFREGRQLIRPERFTAKSGDSSEVEAWLMRRAGFAGGRRYPVLLNIHGGPFTQYGNRFFDEFQVYAGAGYAVLFSNPRGSSGYSEGLGAGHPGAGRGRPGVGDRGLRGPHGRGGRGPPPVRLPGPGTGGGHGRVLRRIHMTSWIVGHTDRFRAACSERAVNNLLSEDGSSDIASFFKSYVGAYVWEVPEAYLKMSPITHAADITTPLLIVHSEDDLRCPVGQAEDLFTILRALKREAELVRFPAEGHQLSRSGSPSHRVMRFQVILDWFARHLRPGEESAGAG